jgi:integrase
MVIVLRQALKQAERLSVVQRNVAVLVSPPRPARKEMLTLSAEQAQHFLEIAAVDRFSALYILALTTGMREGELLGPRWHDVDLEKGFCRYT